MKDNVLITWIIGTIIYSTILLCGSVYLVIWKGCSGWWIVLALALMGDGTLLKILKNKYGIK